MAALSAADRLACRAEFNDRNGSERLVITGLTKADIAAAVAGIDDFLDTNATALNSAVPLPARTALTARQKAFLFVAVIKRRYGV